jgi:hypothetical protein
MIDPDLLISAGLKNGIAISLDSRVSRLLDSISLDSSYDRSSKWVTAQGQALLIREMGDKHLANSAKMVWNDLVHPEFRIMYGGTLSEPKWQIGSTTYEKETFLIDLFSKAVSELRTRNLDPDNKESKIGRDFLHCLMHGWKEYVKVLLSREGISDIEGIPLLLNNKNNAVVEYSKKCLDVGTLISMDSI